MIPSYVDLEQYKMEEDEADDEDDEDEDEEDEKKETDKTYGHYIRGLSATKKAVYISATLDNPEDDSLFYEYKVRQAITEGYLTDYQFVFPIFEQDDVTNEQLADYMVTRQRESHCIVYASSCEEGRQFKNHLNRIQKGCAGYIDKETSRTERKRLFAEFDSGEIRFLINVRVLVEGFNAPRVLFHTKPIININVFSSIISRTNKYHFMFVDVY